MGQCSYEHNEYVHEYKIHEKSPLHPKHNTKFLTLYTETLHLYEQRSKQEPLLENSLIRSIIYDVLDVAAEED